MQSEKQNDELGGLAPFLTPFFRKGICSYRRIVGNGSIVLLVLFFLLCISCGRHSDSDADPVNDPSIASIEEAVRLLKADAADSAAAAYVNAQWQTHLDTPELFCRYFKLMYEPKIGFRQIHEVGRPAVITLGNGIGDLPDFHFRYPSPVPHLFEGDIGVLLDDHWVDCRSFSDDGRAARGNVSHDVSRFIEEAAIGVHSLRLHVRVRMYGSLDQWKSGTPLWESEWSGPRSWFSVVEELPDGYLSTRTDPTLDAEMNKRLFAATFRMAVPGSRPDKSRHYGILAEGQLPIDLGHSVWASVNAQAEKEICSSLPYHYGHNGVYRDKDIYIDNETAPRRNVNVVFAFSEFSVPDWLGLKSGGGSSTVKFLLKPSLSSAVQNTSAVEYWGGVFTSEVVSVPFE